MVFNILAKEPIPSLSFNMRVDLWMVLSSILESDDALSMNISSSVNSESAKYEKRIVQRWEREYKKEKDSRFF